MNNRLHGATDLQFIENFLVDLTFKIIISFCALIDPLLQLKLKECVTQMCLKTLVAEVVLSLAPTWKSVDFVESPPA